MADIEFRNLSGQVEREILNCCITWLHEASGEVVSAAARNSRVDTGQLKSSWKASVSEASKQAVVGSPLENAIWEEFGTGEYALHGDGRRGGWFYKDAEGKGHFTHGKTPNRTLERAYTAKKAVIQQRLETALRGLN